MENQSKIARVISNIERLIVGKRDVIEYALITLFAGGHLLLEDVPGVGKTTLAKALADNRLPFTDSVYRIRCPAM